MSPAFDERRLMALLDGLARMASGETSRRLPISNSHDELDAIAYGINVLADELRWTSERMAEAESRATIELRRLKEEAERANEAKTVFLRNASHEIRTPIAAILSLADLLASGGLSDRDRADLFARLIANGQALLSLVNNLLDLSRVEADRLAVILEPVSLRELVAGVVHRLEGEALRKGLEVRVKADGDVDLVVETDALRLRQILSNLVVNALKFTDKGWVEIGVRAVHGGDRSQVEIDVTDTGIGITREQYPFIFEPFAQADSSISRTHGGTGLGLALSRRLAERLGGTVSLVRSTPGRGSTFRCTLGTRRVAPALAPPVPKPAHPERVLDGCRILVVDDNEDLQRAISFGLTLYGATIESAGDGYQAVDKALTGAFDVVLMDMHMPRLDGLEATRRLRGAGCDVPVIALSADATVECRTTSIEAGCDLHISKPFDSDDLVESIRSLCAGGRPIMPLHHD